MSNCGEIKNLRMLQYIHSKKDKNYPLFYNMSLYLPET